MNGNTMFCLTWYFFFVACATAAVAAGDNNGWNCSLNMLGTNPSYSLHFTEYFTWLRIVARLLLFLLLFWLKIQREILFFFLYLSLDTRAWQYCYSFYYRLRWQKRHIKAWKKNRHKAKKTSTDSRREKSDFR